MFDSHSQGMNKNQPTHDSITKASVFYASLHIECIQQIKSSIDKIITQNIICNVRTKYEELKKYLAYDWIANARNILIELNGSVCEWEKTPTK